MAVSQKKKNTKKNRTLSLKDGCVYTILELLFGSVHPFPAFGVNSNLPLLLCLALAMMQVPGETLLDSLTDQLTPPIYMQEWIFPYFQILGHT